MWPSSGFIALHPSDCPLLFVCLGAVALYWQRAVIGMLMVKGLATEFQLSKDDQSQILSSFFIGYMISGALALYVMNRPNMGHDFAAKLCLLAIAVSTFCTCLMAMIPPVMMNGGDTDILLEVERDQAGAKRTSSQLSSSNVFFGADNPKLLLYYLRLLSGLVQAFYLPASYAFYAQECRSSKRKTEGLGRLASAANGALASVNFVGSQLEQWRTTTWLAALTAVPWLVIFGRGWYLYRGEYRKRTYEEAALSSKVAAAPIGNSSDQEDESTTNGCSQDIHAAKGKTSDNDMADVNVVSTSEGGCAGEPLGRLAEVIESFGSILVACGLAKHHSVIAYSRMLDSVDADPSPTQHEEVEFGLEDEQEKQDSGTLSGPPLVSQLSTSTSSGPLVVGNLCEEQQPLGAVLHLGRKSSRNQSNIKEQEDDDFTDDDFTRREPTLQLVQQLGKHTDVDGADGEDDDGTFSSNINDSTTLVMHTNAASTTTKKGSSGKIFTSKTVLGGRPFTTTSPSSDNLSLYSSTSSSTTSSKFERILTILRNAWQEGSIVENLPRTVTALANVDPRLVILRVIFTKTYLAVMSGHFSHTFMAFMLMAWLPTFFGKDNAFYTGFPFLISMIASPLWPEYARRQLEAKKPLLGVRKQVGFVGIFTPAIGLLLALACGDDLPILKTLCFTLTIASGAAAGSSVTAAPLDLAGREHAGALFACSNAVAAIPGILGVRLGKNMAVGVLVCALYKIFAAAVYVRYVSVDRII